MSFNNLANTILEGLAPLTTEETEGRKPNPDFQAWKSSQSPEFISSLKNPYTHWYLKVKGKGAGDAPVPSATVAPAPKTPAMSGDEATVEYIKTADAVSDFLSGNPGASVEEVVAHLRELNDAPVDLKWVYITHPDKVAKMMSTSSEEAPVSPSEPAAADIDAEKAAKLARLRKFMSMPRAERDKYLAQTKKSAFVDDEEVDKDPEEEEDEDPYVRHYVKKMRGEDDDDDEPEDSKINDQAD